MIECSSILKDVEGKPWAIQASGQPFVYFDYNPVGDNTMVYSSVANDWERNFTYDWLGRRLTYTEGELAETLTYNGGNLSSRSQGWLENGGTRTSITQYHYTAHRLDSISFADALTTIYHYDQYGRVDSLYDESGVVCYEYGNMGEVTQETRIYALPFLTNALALSTQFEYDSWGRILNITYPDNEVVNYTYDCGGQLFRFCNNSNYSYLDSVLYDKFGAKASQKYGNGLKTNYSYNNLTRRLSNIITMDGNSQTSSFAYSYDPVGNVTQVASSCPWLQNQTFTEVFTYDASDQLTSATEQQHYQLSVTYGNWGKVNTYDLTQKDLRNHRTHSESQVYTYPIANSIQNSQSLFAPQQRTITDGHNNVSTEYLTFGINGSLRKREVQSQTPYTEYYLFNSAANLKVYSNNGLDFAYYGYNSANTRTYKLSFLNTNQWVNGQPQPLDLQLQNAMFYPNAYLNFNQNGEYTKHYYNGSERIASRLGNNTQMMDATSNDRLDCRVLRAEELMLEGIQELVSEGQPVEFHSMPDPNALQPTIATSNIFYYHTNHLGSTAFVTDQNQNITQGFLYAPFGEITTEYNATFGNDIIPKYSFNAKELDEETGMYYYEARYYKPPVFTSRDAMMDQKPWLNPYHYCSNNPVGRVDPSGCEDMENPVFDKNGKLLGATKNPETNKPDWSGIPLVVNSSDDYDKNLTAEETMREKKAIPLDEYGEGISISKSSWEKIVSNGGEEQIPFVRNKSSKTIYYKPETTIGDYKNEEAYPIEAGKDLYMPVDGIAVPHYRKGEVLKLTNGKRTVVTNNSVSVPGGIVMFIWGGWKNSSWHLYTRSEITYPVVRENQPVYYMTKAADKSWDKLFSKSIK